MELLGRVNHGVIVPEGDVQLPEGVTVRIVYEPQGIDEIPKLKKGRAVKFPLVRTGEPGTLDLTNEKIAEILDEEDFSPGR
jgi:hypothetical protein